MSGSRRSRRHLVCAPKHLWKSLALGDAMSKCSRSSIKQVRDRQSPCAEGDPMRNLAEVVHRDRCVDPRFEDHDVGHAIVFDIGAEIRCIGGLCNLWKTRTVTEFEPAEIGLDLTRLLQEWPLLALALLVRDSRVSSEQVEGETRLGLPCHRLVEWRHWIRGGEHDGATRDL